ncbi:MAG: transcriptional regulator, MarR family [Solirubrobacterales bacterium]|nr:transcriptional regulator, MarR family [Solirubrobacterales bacterium]
MSETVSRSTDPTDFTATELGAWRGMLRVHACLVRALDAQLDAAHGLPITSYEVLIHLGDAPNGQMRMRDLADAALLSRSGLTRLVDRLERDGLIERASCPSDARGAFAVITEAGRELLDRARPAHRAEVRRQFLDHFDEDELEQLAGYWERVLPGSVTDGPGPSATSC